MNRVICAAAFVLGLAAVGWVGIGFVGSSWTALAMTAAIAAVYLLGAVEIRRFRAANASLAGALNALPIPLTDLDAWLSRVHPDLQGAVRLRIEGERVALPGPALTPYLVGLLVMLGMLGTFLGMILTFKGAAFALEGSTDLKAIRSALAAPISGLGLSFGASVAGVAASAMLGLMAAISRRERLVLARLLDVRTATVLRPFSLAHLRRETYQAVSVQAQAFPAVLDRVQDLLAGMEQRHQQLSEQLLAQQAQAHHETALRYTALAAAVERTLKESLSASTTLASEQIVPLVEAAMTRIAAHSADIHRHQIDTTQAHLAGLSHGFGETVQRVSDTWQQSLEHQAQADRQRLATWTSALTSAAATLQTEWQRVGDQTLAHQQTALVTLEKTATDITQASARDASQTLAAINQLLATAAELPLSGSDLIGQLRQETTRLTAHAGEAIDVATHVTASAVELASLGESFNHGVQLFTQTNERLMASLQRIEGALGQSLARSDEQLAYYVAQAREVIDLSITSQQGILDDLRRLHHEQAALPAAGR